MFLSIKQQFPMINIMKSSQEILPRKPADLCITKPYTIQSSRLAIPEWLHPQHPWLTKQDRVIVRRVSLKRKFRGRRKRTRRQSADPLLKNHFFTAISTLFYIV